MKPCVLIVLAGCGWIGVEGSGKPGSEVRPVTGFSAIDISSAVNAEIAIGAAERVEISGDDNLVSLVATELNGKRLVIETRKHVRPKLPLVARITALQLGALDVSGSSNVSLHGMHDDRLALNLSGSAVIRGDGTVGQFDIDVSGSGSLELDQLAAERASVTVSGSGNVVLAVSRTLDVHISGSATVTYRGDPEVKQDISGSGRLIKR